MDQRESIQTETPHGTVYVMFSRLRLPASRTIRSTCSNPAHVPGVAMCPAMLLLRPPYACRPSRSFITLC
ncbi:hypothetical protein ACWFQ8_21045 [Streptomyces sp. NPDC055254]